MPETGKPTLDELRGAVLDAAVAILRLSDARVSREYAAVFKELPPAPIDANALQWIAHNLAALLEDAERLDWLKENRTKLGWAFQMDGPTGDTREGYFLKTQPHWTFLAVDFREAIDSARTSTQEKE